jgi:membrane-associated phospholipid phosphatase
VAIIDVDQDKKDRCSGSPGCSGDGRRRANASAAPWRRHLHRHSLLSGATAVLIGYFILTAVLVAGGLLITHPLAHSVGAWDEHVNRWFARQREPAGNRLSGDFTFLADTPGIAAVATLAVVVTFLLRRARLAMMLIVALVTELTVFLTVNYAVERPRPHVPHLASTPSTYSWPSGHVAATLTLYGGIALVVAAMTARPVPRAAAWVVAVCLVVCVAGSRVYEGEHHPTDVLGGLLLAVGALWVANRAIRAWQSAAGTVGRPR